VHMLEGYLFTENRVKWWNWVQIAKQFVSHADRPINSCKLVKYMAFGCNYRALLDTGHRVRTFAMGFSIGPDYTIILFKKST